MTEGRRPVHLAVLAGASAGIYAATLAVVAAIQSNADATIIEARSPVDVATRSATLENDLLTGRLDQAEGVYAWAAAGYDRTRPRLDGVESTLDRLAGAIGAVTGAARSLPDHAPLPPVSRTIVPRTASAAHVTSGASGH